MSEKRIEQGVSDTMRILVAVDARQPITFIHPTGSRLTVSPDPNDPGRATLTVDLPLRGILLAASYIGGLVIGEEQETNQS